MLQQVNRNTAGLLIHRHFPARHVPKTPFVFRLPYSDIDIDLALRNLNWRGFGSLFKPRIIYSLDTLFESLSYDPILASPPVRILLYLILLSLLILSHLIIPSPFITNKSIPIPITLSSLPPYLSFFQIPYTPSISSSHLFISSVETNQECTSTHT